jgi:protein-tyrosine phosphatase
MTPSLQSTVKAQMQNPENDADNGMDVLFVCTGNTCRSPMAAAYLAHLCRNSAPPHRMRIHSAGVAAMDGMPVASEARYTLEHAGITPPETCSHALTEQMVRRADLIVAMTQSHARQILKRFPGAAGKVRLLLSYTGCRDDVPDPYGGSHEVYRRCLEHMAPAIKALAGSIANISRTDASQ